MKSGTRTARGHEPYGTNCTARRMGGRGRGGGALTHVVGDLRADAEGREGHDCEELRTASV